MMAVQERLGTTLQEILEMLPENHSARQDFNKRDHKAEAFDGLVAALRAIDEWSEAYPVNVFRPLSPEQWAAADAALCGADLSLDAISADNIRTILKGAGDIARAALAAAEGENDAD